MEYIDTHAHIHFPDYGLNADEVWKSSVDQGVKQMVAVGCKVSDSREGIEFAKRHAGIWAAVGIHPHYAANFLADPAGRTELSEMLDDIPGNKVVALGEVGLDYYYEHSDKKLQIQALEFQLELAEKYDLAVIFHVRDAFADFWKVYDRFHIKRGVIHSFTGVQSDVGHILQRGLFVGLNGIVTFTKQNEQLDAVKSIPLEKIVLETDAPYLTPAPFRGKICKPEHVKLTAAFLADLRGEPLELLANQTTLNARRLFNIN